MFKVLIYLTRCQGTTREEFIDYYENHHVPLVLSLASMPRVYKRNYVVRGDAVGPGFPAVDFDVVTELVWDDRAGFEEWMALPGVPEIAEDEAKFQDRSKTRVHLVDERVSAAE